MHFWYKRAWVLLALGALLYLWVPVRRLVGSATGATAAELAQAFAYVPINRITGDLAKMLGYPRGVWWRLRRGKNDG